MRFWPLLPPTRFLKDPDEAIKYLDHVHQRALAGVWPVLDTETTDTDGKPDPDEINGLYAMPIWLAVTLPDEMDDRVAIPIRDDRVRDRIAAILHDEKVVTSWHNASYDYPACQNLGIEIRGPIFDTKVADVLLFPETRNNRHSIDAICEDFFDIKLPKYLELYNNPDIPPVGGGKPTRDLADYSDEIVSDYACSDTWRGAMVLPHHRDLMAATPLGEHGRIGPMKTLLDYYWTVEEPHLKALFRMERRGAPVNRTFMEDLSVKLVNEEQRCLAEVFKLLGGVAINVNSNAQMAELLFDELGLSPTRKTKSGWSTDSESIENCLLEVGARIHNGSLPEDSPAAQIIKLVVRAKDCGKTRSTFVDGILVRLDGANCIHTSYGLARTGRIRSYNPNLTNLPNVERDEWNVREAWVPPEVLEVEDEETMVVADYSQVELRILAVFSQDKLMLDDINNGRDLHSASAARGLGISYDEFSALKEAGDVRAKATRTAFKTVRFADVYGAEKETLSKQLSKALRRAVTETEAVGFKRQMDEMYPTVARWIKETRAWAHESEFTETILGRRRDIPFINAPQSYLREKGERIAVNTMIQGSAADIVKMAIKTCDLDPELKRLNWVLRMQIHDELVLTGPKKHAVRARERIVEIMENPFEPLGLAIPVPLEVVAHICPNWSEGK